MPRFVFIVASSGFYLLYMMLIAAHYCRHPEKYDYTKRFSLVLKTIKHLKKRGRTVTHSFGHENIPNKSGYIMYANHQGKYDALGILGEHKSPCALLMEKSKADMFGARQALRLIHGKAIDFTNPRQQVKVINQIGKEVKQGMNYLIFPEGGYKGNGNILQEFKSGAFKCAFDSMCPVIPVAIIDSYKAFEGFNLKKVETYVHFLKPINFEEYKDLNRKELAELVKSRIQELLDSRIIVENC